MYYPSLPPLKMEIKRLPRMNEGQLKQARKLIQSKCCNYDKGHCIILDDGIDDHCAQWITYSLICPWFREAVLSASLPLKAEILGHKGATKQCAKCGKRFIPGSNSAKYCTACGLDQKRKSKAAWARRKRG